MNYVLSFCKITAASKTFSRKFYLPLLKPLTPKDALRTFRITGKWLLGSKIQHYIPVLLNHAKKRSKREKSYGKQKHERIEDYVYMVPFLDPDNIESHRRLCALLKNKKGEGAFAYAVNDKNYCLVIEAPLELAIRDGDVIDVLMSQGSDKILVKLRDFKKVPVEIQQYTGNGKLFKGEGATTKEDERHHHHGKTTMSIVKLFEDLERKEEKWEEVLKRLLEKRRPQPGEGTKEWSEMIRGVTANMDWKKYEKQAKRIVQYVEEPIVEYYVGMEVHDLQKTQNLDEVVQNGILKQLPTLSEIPELINNMTNAIYHEVELSSTEGPKIVSGAKVTLLSGKECFVIGQTVKTEEGEVFVPGQTVENEFGTEFAPGITVWDEGKPGLVNGLIVGDPENKNPMFAILECTITEAGYISFAITAEERVKYKPRKVPVKKVVKSGSQNPEDSYEEYYYEDTEDFVPDAEETQKAKKKLRRVLKKRRVAPAGVVYNAEHEDQYEEEEYSEYEEIDDEEEERLNALAAEEREKATAEEALVNDEESAEKPLTLEEIIETYKKQEDVRTVAFKEILEEEKQMFKAMDAKIEELIENIEEKKAEVQEKLEELRNMTVPKEIDAVATASFDDAAEIASKITNSLRDADIIAEVVLTMVRRLAALANRNAVNIDNINNPPADTSRRDERSRRCEKLKITLKTALVAANNVFINRPQDEVSALKAIGTVLTLALEDQEKLIAELCYLMKDPMNRNDTCAMLLKELTTKYKKDKIKTLKSIVENVTQEDGAIVDRLKDVLEKRGDVIGPAFKKIAKDNPDLLKSVVQLVKGDVKLLDSESNAMRSLQDAIVKSVKDSAEKELKEFVAEAKENEFEDFIKEAAAFAQVLGLNGSAHELADLPRDSKILSAVDRTCLSLFKRLMVIRKLAQNDKGEAAALKEIKKHPEFGTTNPRIRQLVRESAALLSNAIPIKNSKQIPEKLMEEQTSVALEDYLIQKSRVELPVLVSRMGKQAVVPAELTRDVLDGRVPYVLIDEDGVSDIKPLKKFANGIANSKDLEKSLKDYSPFGSNDRKNDEKWAEVPVRNRARRMSNYKAA